MLALLFAGDLAAAHPASPPRPMVAPVSICGSPAVDLDGDAVVDAFRAVADSCGTGGCQYEIALSRAPARRIGVISACWFELGKKRSHGLAEIVTWWRMGASGTVEQRYHFDGRKYR